MYEIFDMRTITASEARQGLAEVIEAARREPVVIQRQKRDVAVVMSMDEYERLVNLNVAEFQRFCDQVGAKAQQAGMTEEVLQGLLSSADWPQARHRHQSLDQSASRSERRGS